MLRNTRVTLGLACVLVGALPSAARAADSLMLTFGDDPTEEVPFAVTADFTSDKSSSRIMVTVKPAGGQGCGASYGADAPNSTDVIDQYRTGGSGRISENRSFQDPGDYTFCGYLQDNHPDTSPRAATGPINVTVRSARATVALTVPERVDPGQTFGLSAPVTAELRRRVVVTMKPAGGRGCEPNYQADAPVSTDVLDEQVQGTQTPQRSLRASDTEGTFLLCAYVQETTSGDLSPEATASAQFRVAPNPCVVAKDAAAVALREVARANRAVRRARQAVARYQRAARRTHGARHRRNAKKLRAARRKYVAAKHRRTGALSASAARDAEARQVCGA